MSHEKQREEQRQALAAVTHRLNSMLSSLRIAHDYNHVYALGLELPKAQPLVDLIDQCAHMHQAAAKA